MGFINQESALRLVSTCFTSPPWGSISPLPSTLPVRPSEFAAARSDDSWHSGHDGPVMCGMTPEMAMVWAPDIL